MSQDVDIQKLRKRATTGARWTGTATGIRIATQFIQLAILARLLKVEDFGLIAMVNVVLSFAQTFGDAGVSNAIIHYRDAKRGELSSLYWLNVASGILVFIGMWFLAPLASQVYRQPLTDYLRLGSIIFVMGPLGQQFQVLFERDLRFKRLAAIETVSIVVSSGVGVVMAFMGYGVWSLVWLGIVQAALKSLALAVVGWSTWRPMLRFVPAECRRFLHFGLYQMGERTLNLAGQHLDKLVIGIVMGPQQLGYYDLAYRLIARPYQIVSPVFSRVAFPVFSAVQTDRNRMRKGYLELIEMLSAVTVPVYFAMFALAEPFVLLQLGPGYETTVHLLRILCIVGFFFSISSPQGTLVLACGRADIGFYMNGLRTALVVAGIWIGGRWGLSGIAWALVIVVGGVMFPVHAMIRRRLVGMQLGEFMNRLLPFVWASIPAALVCIAVRRVVTWPHAAVELAVMLPIAGAIYSGLLWWRARTSVQRLLRLARS